MAQFPGDPADIVAVEFVCTIRFCRALHGRGRRSGRAESAELDGRASVTPHESDNPLARYVTTSSGYITHRLTGQALWTPQPTTRVSGPLTRTTTWSADPAAYLLNRHDPRDAPSTSFPPAAQARPGNWRQRRRPQAFQKRSAGVRHGPTTRRSRPSAVASRKIFGTVLLPRR